MLITAIRDNAWL